MDTVKFKVTQTFLTRVLGTAPADKDVYTKFIAAKKVEAEELRRKFAERHGTPQAEVTGTQAEEVETISEEKGLTVFHNDLGKKDEFGQDGRGLYLYDYQILGQFKEAAEILNEAHGIKQVRSKLDNFLKIRPRRAYFVRDGKPVTAADGRFERPIRVMTMQGPRVSLVSSECLEPGCSVEYVADFLPYLKKGSGKEAKTIDLREFSELVLGLGERRGTCQFRNGGFGTFKYVLEPLSPGFEKK